MDRCDTLSWASWAAKFQALNANFTFKEWRVERGRQPTIVGPYRVPCKAKYLVRDGGEARSSLLGPRKTRETEPLGRLCR